MADDRTFDHRGAYRLGEHPGSHLTASGRGTTPDSTNVPALTSTATIENIALWDWLPLSDTYAQLQEIRTYYKFHDLDVDRYWLDGSYQSVMLSARELRSSLLPPNAQTWVNRHVLFTHGNGAVMSPVTRKRAEGLPIFYLRNIPPVADVGPRIDEPRIYFGEQTDDYVVVKGSIPEFDYPKGKENAYAAYGGAGGISIGAMATRMLFAYYLNDPNLLPSGYITIDSRIMIRRNIQERVSTIAPSSGSIMILIWSSAWAHVLDAGRLHDERLFPVCRARKGARSQLHSQFGEGCH